MKSGVLRLLCIIVLMGMLLTSCSANGNKCKVCHGSGYYQKRTCVFCGGDGRSDNRVYNDLSR